MMEYGVANANRRKLISGDDQGTNSGNALMYSIYSNKQKLCLDKIMCD